MTDNIIRDQAMEISATLPKIIRRLFAMEADDPAMDLPVAQVRVCGVLQDGPRTITCLSKELGISTSAATQIADRLEKSGLVERLSETDDRRVKNLQLTSQGAEIMRRRREKRIERIQNMLKQVSPEDREKIISVLQTLLKACVVMGTVYIADSIPAIMQLLD